MSRISQTPRTVNRPPRALLPQGACDCHAHVIGPADRYPTRPGHPYAPVEANIETYEEVLRTLGFERTVLVQPSCYGTDNRCLLEALQRMRLDCRAIAVTAPDVDRATLASLDAAGVRGVRVNLVGGGLSAGDLQSIASRVADYGWHVQIYATGDVLAALGDDLSNLPTDLVIDHLGHCHPAEGLQQPGFEKLLRLLESARTWVKLSAVFRVSNRPYPHEDVRPFARRLIEAAPERMVWGTDWPHAAFWGTMPDTTALLDLLLDWLGDEATIRAMLSANPARLYGFD